jgi:hypothetical protein
MSATKTELRKRHQAETNETPEIDSEEDSDSRIGEIPTPSIERNHLLVIGVIVAIILALYLYRRNQSGASTTLDDVRDDDLDPEATIEDDEEAEITVPHETGNPLAGDKAVIEAFQDREIISGVD